MGPGSKQTGQEEGSRVEPGKQEWGQSELELGEHQQ